MYELVYPSGKVNFCMTYGLHELPWTYSRISVQELFQPLVIDPQVDFVRLELSSLFTLSPPLLSGWSCYELSTTQSCPTELARMTEVFYIYTIQYSSH